MIRKLLVLGSLLIFGCLSAHAQRAIAGKVQDESGEALPGVSVVLKGTSTGTVTDAQETFQSLYRSRQMLF